MKTLVAIPCYNCRDQISRVLNKLPIRDQLHYLVVDNKSTDDTAQVIRNVLSEKKNSSITFVQHFQNYGLGGTFKTVCKYALENNYQYLIFFHGDDQASELDLLAIWDELLSKDFDCLLGARFMPGSKLNHYSKIREFGNIGINFIYSIALGRKIYDIGSGLNAFKVSSLPHDLIERYPNHIAYDINILFHYVDLKQSFKTAFFPIQWAEQDQKSNANNLRVGLKVMSMLAKYLSGERELLSEKSPRDFKVLYP